MKVDVKEFEEYVKYISKINGCPIEFIEIFKEGKKIDINDKDRRDFEYTSLSNKDFIKLYLD